MENCKLHGAQKIKFPEAGDKKGRNKVKYMKNCQLRLPVVIYKDFEGALCKQDAYESSS